MNDAFKFLPCSACGRVGPHQCGTQGAVRVTAVGCGGSGGLIGPFSSIDECVSHSNMEREKEAASQQPVWNGEGLPPVGCECELFDSESGWETVVIKFIGNKTAVVDTEDGEEYSFELSTCDFRPIRSEADKKRDECIVKLTDAICGEIPDTGMATAAIFAERVYDAIAGGKIPGVKLEG